MPVTCNAVWQRIISEGIATAQESRLWADQAKKISHQSESTSGEQLLKALVGIGVLSSYQARVIAGKADGKLRKGDWIVRGPVAHPLGKGWWLIHPAAGKSKADPEAAGQNVSAAMLWGRWLSLQEVTSFLGTEDVTDLLDAIGDKSSRQSISVAASTDGDGQVFFQMPAVSEPTMADRFQETRPEGFLPGDMMIQLTRQVAELHSLGLAHGRLAPDRILWDGQLRVSLIYDPLLSLSRRCRPGAAGLLASRLSKEQLADFIAPEANESSAVPSAAADVYSLGMIWQWLLQQKEKQEGAASSRRSIIAEQTIKKCLSVDPNERFTSAVELLATINTARPVIQKKTPVIRKKKAKKDQLLLLSLVFGFAGLLLAGVGWLGLVKIASHAETSSPTESAQNRQKLDAAHEPDKNNRTAVPFDDHFRIVDNQQVNWLPPLIPNPVDLKDLPPGAQAYLSLRPRQMANHDQWKAVFSVLQRDPRWNSILERWTEYTGLPIESVEQMLIAFYGSISEATENSLFPGLLPEMAVRVELNQTIPLETLLNSWNIKSQQHQVTELMWPRGDGHAYFIPADSLLNDEAGNGKVVSSFCMGSEVLIKEMIETTGERTPLVPAFKRLLDRSIGQADFCLLASPRYLLREQKALQQLWPRPIQELIETTLGRDSRAVMIQSHLNSEWYWEIQRIPERESDSALIAMNLSQRKDELRENLAEWLNINNPLPNWQSLADRLPSMFSLVQQHSRCGVEDGIVLVNGYLPSVAFSNVLVASWMLLNDSMLGRGGGDPKIAVALEADQQTAFDINAFLEQPIRVFFEQESLENAVQMLQEAAGQGRAKSEKQVRFSLDPVAFERAGITRNKQLRDFRFENESLQDALTEIARRGNPIPNVDDPRKVEQQLVWIVQIDPQQSLVPVVMFTTRAACIDSGWEMPAVFASP